MKPLVRVFKNCHEKLTISLLFSSIWTPQTSIQVLSSLGQKILTPDAVGDTSGKVDNKKDIKECRISSNVFMLYYWILMFLLCFATPVLVTSSLNVFIYSAVKNTTYEVNNFWWFQSYKLDNIYSMAINILIYSCYKIIQLTGCGAPPMANTICLCFYVGPVSNRKTFWSLGWNPFEFWGGSWRDSYQL